MIFTRKGYEETFWSLQYTIGIEKMNSQMKFGTAFMKKERRHDLPLILGYTPSFHHFPDQEFDVRLVNFIVNFIWKS